MIVLYPTIRSFLIHKYPKDIRVNSLNSLQEYDLEIKPSKLVRGQGLCKLATKALDPKNDEEGWENEAEFFEREVLYVPTSTNSWYNELKYYLTHGKSLEYMDT